MTAKLEIKLVNVKTLAKSSMEFEGEEDYIISLLDKLKRTWKKEHPDLDIADYKLVTQDGKVATQSKEPCTVCGRVSDTGFEKIVKSPQGIAITRFSVRLCETDFNKFASDAKFRAFVMTLGLRMHVAGPDLDVRA